MQKQAGEMKHDLQNGKNSRREVLKAAMAIGVSLPLSKLLAGCAPAAAPTASPSAPVEETVTLRMQNWFGETDMWAWQVGLDMVRVAYPKIELALEYNDYGTTATKVVASAAAGDVPDIIMASTDHTPLLASSSLLLDLNPYIELESAAVNVDDFAPGISKGFNMWGRWWGFPYDHSTFGIYYNKNLFAKAGVSEPPGEGGKPWSLDEFLDAAKKLTLPDGSQFGVTFPWNGNYLASNFIYTFGGRIFDDNLRECVINSDEAAAGIQWLADLLTKHKVAPSVAEQTAGTVDYFGSGVAAMHFNGQWDLLNKNTNTSFPFEIGYLPIGDTKRSVTGGSGFCPSVSTKYPQQCYDFVKTYTSKAVLEPMVGRTGRGIPARTSAMPAYLMAGGRAKHPNVFVEQLGWSFNDRLSLAMFEFNDACKREMEAVFSGTADARAALDNIAQTTNVAVEEKRKNVTLNIK